MSEMYGADVEALRALGTAMERHGETLELAVGQLTEAVTSVQWSGQDHEEFLNEWQVRHAVALLAVAQAIAAAGAKAVANADAQEQTSASYDGGGGGGPSGIPEGTDGSSSEGQGSKEKEPAGAAGDMGKVEDIGQVPLDETAIDASKIDQGRLADCWFLASAGAVAESNPKWIQEHIKYNAQDGTYTVTFYRDGEPVHITVEDTAYENAAGDPNGKASWITVYEKAAAVYMGGEYEDMNYDSAETALEMITGKDTSSESLDPVLPWEDPPSLQSIGERVKNGEPVVAASPDGGGWFGDPPPDNKVVGNHVYTVQGVSEDGKTITLVNPWGPTGGTGSDGVSKPGTLTMSAEEFYKNFDSVTYGERTK
ncbi:C2 family cysteine protease [Promicromonospora sp. NPDC050249]|uniref:C2 family cysteine protease n=1 Tax=Promicromonospora sp. NPDC050249 TaxID=3154743 RepID=UPI0033E6523D